MTTANDNTTPDTFTVSTLMQRWSCDRNTILTAIHEKRLKAFKLGKRAYRISRDEVLRYEQAQEAA